MHPLVAKKIFLTKGAGTHKDELESFELALRDAGIQAYNLVKVSSIFPPRCKLIPRKEGVLELVPGQICFLVLSRIATNEPNRLVAASIGVAIPQDRSAYGYLSEHESYGETAEKAGDYAEDLAASMLASTLGLPFNAEQSWDERKQLWKISGKIVKTTNITQSAEGDKHGLWTTVVAGAVHLV
jgi:arginine decarboxylase